MTMSAELVDWLRLTLTPGVGPAAARTLLAAFGSPEAVLNAGAPLLRQRVAREIADAVVAGPPKDVVEIACRWAETPGNHILTLGDTAYPRPLLETADPPVLLYAKGHLELLDNNAIAVVGSRNATPQGMATARNFSRSLGDAGLTIVSGLALGIDTAAHEGGLLSRSSTIAVAGTGLDTVYPSRNRELAHRIVADGLLLSEFPLGTGVAAWNFPRRNRLISGLARGVLVVEAAVRSGSLTTARLAAEQGREVFAIPGSIHSPVSRGCHALIRQGAKLAESAEDVLEELRMQWTPVMPAPIDKPAADDPILHQLGHDPCTLDQLALRTGLPAEVLSARLLELELAGAVATLPGNRVQRMP